MTPRRIHSLTAVLVIALGVPLSAARVKLKSGKLVEGMFIGADSRTIRVLLDSGQVTEIPIGDSVAVEFAARKPAPPRSAPREGGARESSRPAGGAKQPAPNIAEMDDDIPF